MISTTDLWLPILLSAVGVFIASSILHMVIPIHKGDFKKLPGEERILAEMRSQGVQPGSYRFPFAVTMKEMGSPEMLEKLKRGPVGISTVLPSGPCNMGKSLILWFLYSIMISAFAAHLAAQGLSRGGSFKSIFHLTALAATLGYVVGHLPESIWKGQQWSTTFKFVLDGVLYAIVTGLTFGWLWPGVNL
ncbi:MAG: hypothetical protein HY287_07180 [Planctomycetes bacterium]|nr:hypothetical protein [Planctomycetota bacterium]